MKAFFLPDEDASFCELGQDSGEYKVRVELFGEKLIKQEIYRKIWPVFEKTVILQ